MRSFIQIVILCESFIQIVILCESFIQIVILCESFIQIVIQIVILCEHCKVPNESAKESWVGAVSGVTYRVGNGSAASRVRLAVQMTEPKQRIWNVVGRIDGGESDAPVLLGNHRDAWTFGAADPSSGSATLNEVARVLGRMHLAGWRPRRTIILCSWDAEGV